MIIRDFETSLRWLADERAALIRGGGDIVRVVRIDGAFRIAVRHTRNAAR